MRDVYSTPVYSVYPGMLMINIIVILVELWAWSATYGTRSHTPPIRVFRSQERLSIIFDGLNRSIA